MTWLESILDNPLSFLRTLGLYVLIALTFLLIALFLLSRWMRFAKSSISERDFLDEVRQDAEQSRLRALNRFLQRVFYGLGALLVLGLVGLEYNVPILNDLAISVQQWLSTGGVIKLARIALLGFVSFAMMALVRRSARVLTPTTGQRFEREVARAATIRGITESTLRVVLFTLFVLYALSELGAPIGTFLAGLGILGLAVSFGAQSLVKDLISGFFILAEDQYGVGDVIRIGELSGDVEAITLRVTTLRDLDGRVHIIPNGQIDKVTVMSKDWSRALMDVEVAYDTDLDTALNVFKNEADKLHQDAAWSWRMLEPPELLGVQAFGTSGITLRLLFKTLPKEQWSVAREFRKRIKERFEQEGIEIPLPQLKVSLPDSSNS
jgi:moderate conductance mechanosensitive channel